jgi:DNA-binding XRE family transcriptional regulator
MAEGEKAVIVEYSDMSKPIYEIFFQGRWYRETRQGYWRTSAPNSRALHRDLWEAHHGPIPPGHHIHHCDGNPHNNAIQNLECIKASEHTRLHKKGKLRGPQNGRGSLTPEQVLKIRELFRPHRYTAKRLAQEFGVSAGTISAIVNGKMWADLPMVLPAETEECKHGHPWTPESCYVDTKGQKCCRICANERKRAQRSERRKILGPVVYKGRALPSHCPQGHAYDAENTATDRHGHHYCRTCHRASAAAWRAKCHPEKPPRVWSTKTHCLRGHPFDEANTRISPAGHKCCRACSRLKAAEYRAAKKAREQSEALAPG